MTDTARLLLTAAVLSAAGFGAFAWRIRWMEATTPERLIAELRLAQLSAVALAGLGAIPIGLAIAAPVGAFVHLDAALGVVFMTVAAYVLLRDPAGALWLAAAGFILHALFLLAHRPGWLEPGLTPRWYIVGCSIYDVYMAAICYWARWR